MGALTTVLLAPVMAPVWGFRFMLEQLHEEAEAVMYDEGRGFAELLDLSMRRSAGKISDAEFAEQETALLERLSAIRKRRDELLNAELEVDDEDFVDADLEENEDVLLDAEPQHDEVEWR